MAGRDTTTVQFLDYTLDVSNAELRRADTALSVRPKTLAVLQYLVEHAGRLVTKAELLDAVWADTAVGEWVLTGCIQELRRTFADDARQPRIIQTAHGRGYRFIAEVRVVGVGLRVAVRKEQRQSAPPTPDTQNPTPALVGRTTELAQLGAWLQRALTGDRQLVFVAGEPGIGKTTLVDEFLRLLVVRLLVVGESQPNNQQPSNLTTCLIARGQCIEQHGAAEPYLPVLEALSRLCAGSAGAGLLPLLHRFAPAWLVQLPGLLAADEAEALEQRLGASTRARMLREMASFVEALPEPLVLLLEDLHWSDLATLDLLSMLAQRRDRARLMILGTYRPVEVVVREHPLKTMHQELRARGRCADLWLKPLGQDDVADYLATRWPGLESANPLARVLHERTDGNPLFLVNVADYLVAEGTVVDADGRWTMHSEAATLGVGVPLGLRQMIATQIDRLDESERTVLEAGSLIGRTFSAALVAAALDAAVIGVEQHLARLAHKGQLVRAVGQSEWPDATVAGAYELTHFLYQSVLRDRVPPARRRELHGRIAARLEAAYLERVAEVGAELAHHFELSGQPDRAVPYLEEAAARAVRRGAAHEAVELLNRGLALLEGLPVTAERTLRKIRLTLALGGALPGLHGFGHPATEEAYLRARAMSEETNDQVQLFQSLSPLAAIYVAQARLDRAAETAAVLMRLMEEMPLPAFVFAGNLVLGIVQYHAGSLAAASRHLDQAMAMGEVPLPTLSGDLYVYGLGYVALTLLHRGFADQARRRNQEAGQRAAATGRPFDRSTTLQFSCFLHALLRDMPALRRASDEAAALAAELDMAALRAVGAVSRGRVMAASGDYDVGAALMRDGIDAYRASGQRIALPTLVGWLIETHLEVANRAAVPPLLAEGYAIVASTGDVRSLPELHRLEGELHQQQGDQDAAEHSFRRAIALARDHGTRWWELRATTSLARLPLRRSRPAARDALAVLLTSFTEGFDTTDLVQAHRVLAAGVHTAHR